MKNIIEQYIETFLENGDKKAVSDEKSTFTYKELYEYACIIGANLKKENVKYGDKIIIELPRIKEYVGCLLGCWFLGCVTIPLTDDYPEERLNYIKKDSKYKFLIDEKFLKKIDKKISMEPIVPNIEDPGLVIYTSGSTGNPKGVLHNFASMSEVFVRNTKHDSKETVKKNEVAGLIAPFTFIVGMSWIIAGLGLFKHIVIAPDEIRKDPFKLAKYYDDNNIQGSFVPPRMVKFMIEHNKSLKVISVGSERITNLYFNDKPKLNNGYGSTETFGGILSFAIDKSYENTPIGKPFGNEAVYVLDENNNEVEQGELCIAGNVAIGYLNREEETKKVFVKNPFKEKDGYERMFRTRDIVKKLPDGNLVFIERKDWMIKINGQRVEPLEVESTIRSIDGVSQVAVKDFTAKNGVTYLAAYYVTDKKIKEEDIKKYCVDHLTSYMVPSFYIKLDVLPVNLNGKLDRKNLPEPDVENFKKEYEEPIGNIEKDLCNVIEQILDCGRVGRNDDFFLLGGDSIKALDLINELEELPLDVEMIFKGKTPKEIAALIVKGEEDEIQIDRKEKKYYPLTSSQLGIYFPSISNPDYLEYNNPIRINLDKSVNKEKLIEAINKSINNHKAYKCHIGLIDGKPVMIPWDNEFKTTYKKVKDVDEEINKLVKPFNLENDKLIRISLLESNKELVLFFDAHHIVFDGTSLSVLLKEISKLYSGKDIYEEKTSMFDLSNYEEQLFKSNKFVEAKKYYENIFGDEEITNDLVNDFEDQNKFTAGNITVSVKPHKEKLEKFIKSNALSENTLFLSIFSFVLSKFNGNDKSLVCVAENGRSNSMTFNSVGMMVKTIALPIDISKHAEISEFSTYMQNMFKESVKNDIYPFSELANRYGINNDYMFVYQGNYFSTLKLGEKTFEVHGMKNPNAISKISLMVFKEDNGSYGLSFSYRSDLFKEEIIKSFVETYVNVVNQFIEKENLNEINLVSNNQLKLLDSFNDTEKEIDLDKNIIDLFNLNLKKNRNNDLVVYKDKHYTYEEADKISNKIANYIRDLGLKNNDVVSILIPRNEWIVLATLGVTKAGCCYEPLDVTYPSERLSYMVHDANAKLLITTKELEPVIKNYSNGVLYIEDIEDLKNDSKVENIINLNDIFVLLYTSGTTGTPKGVMMTHKNIIGYLPSTFDLFKYNSNSKIAAYASYGFDAGMNDLINTFASGATLYVIDESLRLDFAKLDDYLIKNRITHIIMTTQVARQFATYTKSPYLKYCSCGGEQLVPFDVRKMPFTFYNLYGPTECCIYCTYQKVDRDFYRIPIGKINSNLKAYVVDKNLNRLPIGVPGELLVAGIQVTKGYLNLKDKTEKVFIKNPFNSNKKYNICYSTGDVVRYLADGSLEFIGRNDGQVKIRGFRIELSEIEKVIRDFDGVSDATVQAFVNNSGNKYIAAYFVSKTKINIEEIRKFIASQKPSYMVPELIMQIDKIPLTQNLKVNKKALPLININKTKKEIKKNIKDNIIVKKIKSVIKKILNDDNYNYDDNLLDYGMNSLSLIKLSVLLHEEFNVNVDIKDLLSNCSINAIEDIIINLLLNSKNNIVENKKIIKDEYNLTKSQVGIYAEYLKDLNSTKYNIPMIITIKKENYENININKVSDILINLFDAHESLKATIKNDNGNFVMIPKHGSSLVLKTFKLNKKEYNQFKNDFVKPLDLSKSLYRISLVEIENEIKVFIDIHHIMFDGSSQAIFLDDFEKLLNGQEIEKEKYNIFDISLDEEISRNSEKYNEAKSYYNSLLSVVDGSTEIERDLFGKNKISKTTNIIDKKLNVHSISKFTKENNITLNSFFLTAFSIALSKMTYQNSVCFSTVYNGRNSIDYANLVGMTVKTFPFANSFEGEINIKDLLKENKNQILNSMNNDIYSFGEISRDLGIDMNITFIYQGEIKKKNTTLDIEFLSLNDLKSDIDFEVRNDNNNFYFHLEYDNGKYSDNLINHLVNVFVNVCNEILIKDNLSDINVLDENDINELNKINNTEVEYDKRPLIYQIEETIKKYKSNEAIVFHGNKYTYGDLGKISNKIATYIKSLKLKKDDVVGILLPRNEYIILAPYGVMKANLCFQPLDNSYPSERINFMLKNSEAKLLITSKDLRIKASEYKGKVLYIEDINKLKTSKLSGTTNPDDTFILLYTSGTTGVPKGVEILNRNLSSFVNADIKNRKINSKTISSEYASFGFDAYMMDVFPILVKGGCIHVIDENTRMDIPKLDEYLIENKVTHITMTTQMARQYALFTKSPYLKNISFGGEKIVPFERKDATFAIHNCYGPTEATIYTNYFPMTNKYERVPIGKQNSNLKTYILDRNNNRLPIGAIGELGISGHQVAKGYLNRPEKTASSFIANTFDKEKGYETIYKTGDTVRLLEDGNVDIIGRNDSQVKIRGFRIELTEVEEVIRRYKGIKDVTVNAFENPSGGKFICAYVVSDKAIDVTKINEFIMKEKPSYMVPKVIMQIDSIPLTQNGKVDKKKLPKPDVKAENKEFIAPTNNIEKELCELFEKILGAKNIGINDDFFELGGTSIDAAKVISFAFGKGYDLVYKNIFDNPTPKQLSDLIIKSNDIEIKKENVNVNEFKNSIEPAFACNVSEELKDLKEVDTGNILLFGSTGFLGSHILKELIDTTDKKIICVVRKNELQNSVDRLKTILEYYFENTYDSLFNKRIFVVESDLLDNDIIEKVKKYDFDTIINSAALVKHFANDDSIQKTNTGGAINLINLALSLKKRLVHVSTLSVSGETMNNEIPSDFMFKETMLDIGQIVDNKYIKSKFDAESEIRDAILNKGLVAKIIRVGNLMSRSSDGEFQINFKTNNFMNTIKAFKLIGCVPYDILNHDVEFSQIDLVSKAIVLLAKTNDKFNVFHVNNVHTIQMNNVINELNKHGIKIKCVSNEEFGAKLNSVLNTEKDVRSINSLLAYKANRNENRSVVKTNNLFTLNTLYRLGFYWPLPDNSYLSNLIEYLVSLDFFK